MVLPCQVRLARAAGSRPPLTWPTTHGAASVDAKGRKLAGTATDQQRDQLAKLYEVDDEGGAKEEAPATSAAEVAKASKPAKRKAKAKAKGEAALSTEELEARLEALNRLARGEADSDGADSSSSSEEDDDDAATSDADADVDADAVLAERDIPTGDETRRLAAVNCDWDHMRAVDLLALFQVGCALATLARLLSALTPSAPTPGSRSHRRVAPCPALQCTRLTTAGSGW